MGQSTDTGMPPAADGLSARVFPPQWPAPDRTGV